MNTREGDFGSPTEMMKVGTRQRIDWDGGPDSLNSTGVNEGDEQVFLCQYCKTYATIKPEYEVGAGNHSTAFLACLNSGWFGCWLIPYCFNDCKDVIYKCPSCKKGIAQYQVI